MVVGSGSAAPPGWESAPRVVVGHAALAEPAVVVGRLHEAWASRTPIVIEASVDPSAYRDPVSHGDDLWRLGPGFEDWSGRMHFLVWANSYDARSGEPIWWWSRKAARIGATEGGPADVVLPDAFEEPSAP